jgi:hypothetical protein
LIDQTVAKLSAEAPTTDKKESMIDTITLSFFIRV